MCGECGDLAPVHVRWENQYGLTGQPGNQVPVTIQRWHPELDEVTGKCVVVIQYEEADKPPEQGK